MISKSWSTSEKRAALYEHHAPIAEFCLQLFPLLVVHSDDYGRLDAHPRTIKLMCDPGSPRSVADFFDALRACEQVGLIRLYVVDGRSWLQVVEFDAHQPGLLSKRSIPRSPAPPTHTENSGDSVLRELNLTQPNLTKQNLTQPKQTKNICPETSSGPPLLAFPVVGSRTGPWPLTEAQVARWAAQFPGLDIHAETRKALAWVEANPRQRKTYQGMPAFLVRWFTRVVDRGLTRPPGGRTVSPQTEANLAAREGALAKIRSGGSV